MKNKELRPERSVDRVLDKEFVAKGGGSVSLEEAKKVLSLALQGKNNEARARLDLLKRISALEEVVGDKEKGIEPDTKKEIALRVKLGEGMEEEIIKKVEDRKKEVTGVMEEPLEDSVKEVEEKNVVGREREGEETPIVEETPVEEEQIEEIEPEQEKKGEDGKFEIVEEKGGEIVDSNNLIERRPRPRNLGEFILSVGQTNDGEVVLDRLMNVIFNDVLQYGGGRFNGVSKKVISQIIEKVVNGDKTVLVSDSLGEDKEMDLADYLWEGLERNINSILNRVSAKGRGMDSLPDNVRRGMVGLTDNDRVLFDVRMGDFAEIWERTGGGREQIGVLLEKALGDNPRVGGEQMVRNKIVKWLDEKDAKKGIENLKKLFS